MKLKLTLIIALSIFSTGLFAQKAADKKGQLFGVHFNLSDFNAPANLKDASKGAGYSAVKTMNKGVSLSYWKGLNSKIDFSAKANVIFRDYSAIYQGVTGKSEIGIELEPTVNIRPFSDAAKIAPFLTTGVGVGMYNDKFGGYIPAGGGIQFNFQGETYLLIQAQYKFTLTSKILGDNLFYSFGLAQKF
jgi:hypothetical protein